MFAAPPSVETTVFARIPGGRLLEGPSFDREGQLWITDIPTGRIFRIGLMGNGSTPAHVALCLAALDDAIAAARR